MRIELDDIYDEIEDICHKEIDFITDKGLERLQELTPEDTMELQKSNQRSEVVDTGGKLKTRIFNDNEYAEYVEYSVEPKNYYKGGGRRKGAFPFLPGSKGANMFRKTQDYLDNEL